MAFRSLSLLNVPVPLVLHTVLVPAPFVASLMV